MANLMSADDRRRQKELDEARKAGLAPAERDEDGREINPHIPSYMVNAPWYMGKDKPTLQHQRLNKQDDEGGIEEVPERGKKLFQATKYRKGACENCGSMTHKLKDCLERPRSKGAKYTNKNIAADEANYDTKLKNFEAKRDRWNGYDTAEYARVVDRYEQLEEIRKDQQQKKMAKQLYDEAGHKDGGGSGTGSEPADDEDDDGTRIRDEEAAEFGEVKKRVRTTAGGSTGSVRNLRIREDTAKYLLNLDVNSAYYDPKTRSMREDPNPDKPVSEKTFAGDNYVRKSGDYLAWQSLQLHTLQATEKGVDLNAVANPSLAEKLYQQFKSKKEIINKATKEDILEKYGSAAEKPPEDLALLGGTEKYVEYDRTGRKVIKGLENKARSRYDEDVLVNNHTSVWGSWWREGVWGYACCHQTVKNSFCTGKAGEHAAAQVAEQMEANMLAKAQQDEEEIKRKREQSKLNDYKGPNDAWGSEVAENLQLDNARVKAALAKLDKEEQEALDGDGSKRKYNTLADMSSEVTPEEMEAWRIKRSRGDDPMAAAKAGTAAAGGYDFL